MPRNMLPHRPGLGLIMVALALCLGLSTAIGAAAPPQEAEFLEDWCGDVRTNYESVDVIPLAPSPPGADALRSTFRGECGPGGGDLVLEGFGGVTANDHAEMVLRGVSTVDLTGKQVSFQFTPWGTPVSFDYAEFFTLGASGPAWGIYITQDRIFDFYGNTIEFWINNGTSWSTIEITYDPVAHQFIRFWHDASGSGSMGIDTSPACGTWANQLTVTGTPEPTNVRLGWSTEAYPEGEALIQTYEARWGTIYTAAYPGPAGTGTGAQLCLGLSTEVGAVPDDGPPDGVSGGEESVEGWDANSIPDRWEIWNAQNGTVEIVPASFGGGAYFVPGGGSTNVNIGLGTGRQFVFPTLTAYDFTEIDFFFEFKPIPGGAISSGEVGFLPTWEAAYTVPEVFFDYALGGEFNFLDFFASGETTYGYVRVSPYEPDGAHRFFRVKFTGTEQIWYTSPDCGTWTEQLRTGEMGDPGLSSMGITARLRHEAAGNTGGSFATGPGYLGPFLKLNAEGGLAGPKLCLGLDTEIGGTGGPGCEDWCEDWRVKWETTTEPEWAEPPGSESFNLTIDNNCDSVSGSLNMTGVGNELYGYGYGGIRKKERFNASGQEFVVEYTPRPSGAYDSFMMEGWFVDYVKSPWQFGGIPSLEFVIRQGGRGQTFGDPNDVFLLIDYDPVEHKFFRFWHDVDTNTVGIDTAAACGTWVNRVSGSEALLPRAIEETLQFFNTEVYQDPGDPPMNESTSTWGEIFCAPYPAPTT